MSQRQTALSRLRDHKRLPEILWLGAVFLCLGYYKLVHAANKASFEIDGGYYADVARHVRDGLGLTTNVSLYHQAFSYFPHETAVSPLWPLLYGNASRVFDIFTVGIWLPAVLYFVALVAGFAWGNRLFPGSLFPSVIPGFGGGHVFVLMLGLHREFFQFTSVPYTEGLAFSLLLACLWRFHVIWEKPTAWHGLEMGVWLSGLMLARAQLVLLAIAVFMTLLWACAATPDRRKYAAVLAATAAGFLGIVGSYYFFFLDGFVGNSAAAALLRFDQSWESDLLSKFDPMVNTHGLWEYISDRAGGFKIAFKRQGRFSYARSFYMFQFAVPAALPFIAAYLVRERARVREWWSWLRSPACLPWLMIVLFALGGFASLHLIHKDYFSQWHFARRQGLPALFLFFLALVFLLRNKKLGLAVGVFLLCSGVYLGFNAVGKDSVQLKKRNERGPESHRKGLVKWLNDQGKVTVAMSAHEPQKIAVMTPDVGYHWVYAKTTPADLELITTKLGAKYVLLSGRAHKWPIGRDKAFGKKYRPISSFGGIAVYERN